MKKLILSALLATAFPALAQSTSSSSYTENEKQYGNCAVVDSVDMFTDEVTHGLMCQETSLMDKTEIVFAVLPDGNHGVTISKGIQFHLEDQIEIAIRVDRNELRSGTWDWVSSTSSAALFNDWDTMQSLLAEMSGGERLVIRVGDETGNIRIEGANEAIADFLARTQDILPRFIIPN